MSTAAMTSNPTFELPSGRPDDEGLCVVAVPPPIQLAPEPEFTTEPEQHLPASDASTAVAYEQLPGEAAAFHVDNIPWPILEPNYETIADGPAVQPGASGNREYAVPSGASTGVYAAPPGAAAGGGSVEYAVPPRRRSDADPPIVSTVPHEQPVLLNPRYAPAIPVPDYTDNGAADVAARPQVDPEPYARLPFDAQPDFILPPPPQFSGVAKAPPPPPVPARRRSLAPGVRLAENEYDRLRYSPALAPAPPPALAPSSATYSQLPPVLKLERPVPVSREHLSLHDKAEPPGDITTTEC